MKYNFESNVRKDEFTAKYDDYLLSRLVAGPDRELMFLNQKAVETSEGELVLVIDPKVNVGGQIYPMKSLWSRNELTKADVDALEHFAAVDAIVRIGTFVDENGAITTSEEKPKVIALIDRNRQVFVPSGEKREYKGE